MNVEIPFPQIDPAVFTIPALSLGDLQLGPFPLRWYALAYIAGLLIGWRYANMMASRDRLWGPGGSPLSKDDIDDFAFYAMIGVLLGGRFGYILFYQLPFEPERLTSDPLFILRMWEGGMSFHGGLIGVAIAMVLTARIRNIPLLSLADVAAVATPIGLALGRLANFINGELYGRPTDAPWAMRFPTYNGSEWVFTGRELPVHPSQLYESALEGVVLFVVLAVAVWRFDVLKRPGLATGIFLVGYAAARTFVESFRQPDAHIGFLPGDLTMGMLLSAPMILGGAWLILRAQRRQSPA
ncbi:MAG: prolipoprotein diacylglyceryl transferase [Pseudomonadota bacterium]